MEATPSANFARSLFKTGFGTPLLVVTMLAMMVLPLPPFLLDVLFTFNISLALIVLLACVYSLRPLDFAVFPTVLLVTTLLRLALNVASTRVILLNGHTGTNSVGRVIESFGEVVVGGNFVVGLIVFVILVIINFVVVTKGAGRVSEVSARFVLDAMPGKQMAIDADLNAGLIDQKEAKERRKDVASEADFYGAMDGASKFVRGDAIAGILILVINMVGGIIIGCLQHDMAFGEAMSNYSLLTIGDGLVAQVPSLLLSVAAAIMVTRVSTATDMGSEVMRQMLGQPKALAITAMILTVLGVIPGMPHVAFLSLAFIVGYGAYWLTLQQEKAKAALALAETQTEDTEEAPENEAREFGWQDVDLVDTLGLEIGYRLISLVDANQAGVLLNRIKGVRKKCSQTLGFLIPTVHVRDNLDLSPTLYRILLKGVSVGEAEIYPDREMAIDPGHVFGKIDGVACKDPAFQLNAVWILPSQREYAQNLGYTVVDPTTVIATHLSQVVQDHAHELVGHEDVQKLVDRLAEAAPKLVDALIPNALTLAQLVKLLKGLLEEHIPIRDIRSIAEIVVENSGKNIDHEHLLALVRVGLKALIVQNIAGTQSEIPVFTLHPELEQILLKTTQTSGEQGFVLEPGLSQRLEIALQQTTRQQESAGQPAVLLVTPILRGLLARLARIAVRGLHVLSYPEIPDQRQIKIVATIGAA